MKNLFKGIILAGVSVAAFSAMDVSARAKSAVAQGPVLSMGGSLTAAIYATNQKIRSSTEVTVNSKGNLLFNISNKADNGLAYGAMAVLEFDRSKSNSDRISEAYFYGNHDKIGSFKLGDTEGVESTMMYSGNDVLGGLGGPSGDLNKNINMTRGTDFYTSLAPANDTASKIVYTSPMMHGFQLGLSYTPDTRQVGKQATNRITDTSGVVSVYKTQQPYARKHLVGSLSYNQVINNFNVGVYLLGATSQTHVPDGIASTKNLNQWQIGTLIDYQNWQLGATYFDKGKAYMPTTTNWKNTTGMNVAVGYDFAHNANAAVGYTSTSRNVTSGKAKADITTATVDYVLAPGLVTYFEVDYFRLRAPTAHINTTVVNSSGLGIYEMVPTTNTNNHGFVAILGTKVRF